MSHSKAIGIRMADLSDAEAIATIHHAAYREACKAFMPTEALENHDRKGSQARWRERLNNTKNTVYVADLPSKSISAGFCGAKHHTEKSSEIKYLYIHPYFQNMGIGSILLKAVIHQLQLFGTEEIFGFVLKENEEAKKFYKNAGIHETGEEKIIEHLGCKLRVVKFSLPISEKQNTLSRLEGQIANTR